MERYRGEITVFLSLLMSVLLLGAGALTELARSSVIKSQITMDTANAMSSALAEYNRPMLDKYNIFVLDAAYGRENVNTRELADRMKNYMAGAKGNSGSLLRYSISSFAANDLIFATDDCGQAIYNQISDYMKSKYLIDLAEDLTGLKDTIEEYQHKKAEKESREETTISEETTAGISLFESIADLLKSNKMGQVLDMNPVSSLSVETSKLLSSRRADLFQGQSISSPSISDRYLYNKYILGNFKHCSLIGHADQEEYAGMGASALEYEVEYIIAGKNSDRDNLAEIIDRLVLFREVFNFAYIETDSSKVAEAQSMATTLLALTGSPEIIEAGKHIILAAWAHAEAICDVRSLLMGKKVPLNKSATAWHTQMSAIIFPKSSGAFDLERGMNYEDYLNILLMLENSADLSIRTMDLMEQNIRLKESYENFSLDNCLVGFNLEGTYLMGHIFASIQASDYRYEGTISYEMLN